MLEIAIVVGIVVIAAVMAGRSFHRTMTGKNDGRGCAGNCPGCARGAFGNTRQGRDAFE